MSAVGDWDTAAKVVECMGQNDSNYDWATFISAYTLGRWDPLRTPEPPRSSLMHNNSISDFSAASTIASSPISSKVFSSSSIGPSEHSSQGQSPPQPPQIRCIGEPEVENSSDGSPSLPEITSSSLAKSSVVTPSRLFSPSSHRIRVSVADIRSPRAPPSPVVRDPERLVSGSSPEVVTAAMRWAADRVNLAPLSLPSPEHELIDPMRDFTTAIPGSHSPDTRSIEELSPRRSRLASFWQGTRDVEERNWLATIEGSPRLGPSDPSSQSLDSHFPLPFPASAPTERAANIPDGDYFGDAETANESSKEVQRALMQVVAPVADMGPFSVPVPPRVVTLTRQTSSPLPTSAARETFFPGSWSSSENANSIKAGRTAKEEQLFAENGYLAPPNPLNEPERRRALYK
jgi:hypothetical protein